MIEKLEKIREKYNFLNNELSNPENINNIEKIKMISKQKAELEEIYQLYENYCNIKKIIKETEELLNDNDLREMAIEDLKILNEKAFELKEKLEKLLIPSDENDKKNVIMEIRGAAGGSEANIFAGDLFEMYQKYIVNMGWTYEIINSVFNEAGGFSQIEVLIKGKNVYSKLKFESGSHRVQRVPKTESQGRVHTSTATVVVMPEQENIEIEIKEQDIKIDVYRSSGAGGQSVNTTDSAVRITHLPTNIVVTCQNERSQIKNKEKALKILKTKIYDETTRKHEEENVEARRKKIGTGDRSEKIRTYNYPQNRLTDHRIHYTSMNLDRIMEGNLAEIIEVLIMEDLKLKMENNNEI